MGRDGQVESKIAVAWGEVVGSRHPIHSKKHCGEVARAVGDVAVCHGLRQCLELRGGREPVSGRARCWRIRRVDTVED